MGGVGGQGWSMVAVVWGVGEEEREMGGGGGRKGGTSASIGAPCGDAGDGEQWGRGWRGYRALQGAQAGHGWQRSIQPPSVDMHGRVGGGGKWAGFTGIFSFF